MSSGQAPPPRESAARDAGAAGGGPPPAILLLRSSDHRLGVVDPPLGLLYLAAAIRRFCRVPWDVRVLDLGLLGASWPVELLALLDRTRPEAVGISALTHEMNLARQTGRLVRERTAGWPRRPRILLGGPYPTSSPEVALAQGGDYLDGLLVGEGELALPLLLDRLDADGAAERFPAGELFRGLRGWYGVAGPPAGGGPRPPFERAEPADDLDDLPSPAWDLLPPPALYAARPNWNGMLKGRTYMPVITSRGCPYGCTYCHRIFGRRVRLRRPAGVVEEMIELHDRHGIREIHIIDDIFNIDPRRAKAICDGLIGSGRRLHLAFPNGIRGDLVDTELLEKLRLAGAYKITYGIETASPRLQQETGKQLDLPRVAAAIRHTRRLGMIPAGFFMLGFPGESREEIRETIRFAVRSGLLTAKFFQVMPYPGTELGRRWREEGAGRRPPERLDQYHFFSSQVTCSDLDPREMNDFLVQAYLRFFGRPGRVLALLRRHPRFFHGLRDLRRLYATLLRYRLRRLLAPRLAAAAGEGLEVR